MKRKFLSIFIIITLLACQNNKTSTNNKDGSISVVQKIQKEDTTNYENIIVGEKELSEIEKAIFNMELLEIVKQDNKYKYSCASPANYNYVSLTKDSLFIVEMEPMKYKILFQIIADDKITISTDGEIQREYIVNLIEKDLQITSWKLKNGLGGFVDELSFYAIPVKNLEEAKLSIQDCK